MTCDDTAAAETEGAAGSPRIGRLLAPTVLLCVALAWLACATGVVAASVDTWKAAPATLLVALAVVLLTVRRPTRQSVASVVRSPVILASASVVVAGLVPLLYAPSGADFSHLLGIRITCLLSASAAAAIVQREPRAWNAIQRCTVTLLAATSIVGVLEFGGVLLWRLNPVGTAIASTFYHPGIYAGFLVLALPSAMVLTVRQGPRPWRAVAAFAWVLGVANVLLAQARASILAVLLTTVAFVFLLPSLTTGVRHGRLRLVVLVAVAAACVAAVAAVPSLRQKVVETVSRRNPRWVPYGIAFRMWTSSPRAVVLGNGLGAFRRLAHVTKPADFRLYATDLDWDAVHDEYLELLVEGGLLALVLLLAVAVAALASVRRAMRMPAGTARPAIAAGAALAVVGFLADSALSTSSRVAALAMIFSVNLGALVGADPGAARRVPSLGAGVGSAHGCAPRRSRVAALAGILPVALLAVVAVTDAGLRLASEVLVAEAVATGPAGGAALLERAVRVDPRGVTPWYLLSQARLQRGEAREALRAADEVDRRIPGYLQVGVVRASALLALGRDGEAEAALKVHLRHDERDLSAEATLAVLSFKQRGPQAGAEALGNLVRHDLERGGGGEGGDPTVEFPPGAVVRVERSHDAVQVLFGMASLQSILARVTVPPAASVNAYLFRLHSVLGVSYLTLGFPLAALRQLNAALEQHTAAAAMPDRAAAPPLQKGPTAAATDADRLGLTLQSLDRVLVDLAARCRATGRTGAEIAYLAAHAKQFRDTASLMRLQELYRRLLRFKELRRVRTSLELL